MPAAIHCRQAPSNGWAPRVFRHAGPVTTLAFLADGKRLATGSADGSVRVWEVTTGKELRAFRQPPRDAWSPANAVRTVSVSQDGTTLVASHERGLRAWDLTTGKELFHVALENCTVGRVSPDGRWVAAGDGDGNLFVWDGVDSPGTLDQAHLTPPKDNFPSPTPLTLPRDTPVDTTGHAGAVHSLAFTPDSRTLVSIGADRTLRFRKCRAHGALTATIHVQMSGHLAVSCDGKTLALVDGEGNFALRNVTAGKQIYRTALGQKGCSTPSLTPDGKGLVTAGDGRVVLIEVATAKERLSLPCEAVTVAAVSPDGRVIAAGDQAGLIRTWDAVTGKEREAPQGLRGEVAPIRFSPDGKHLVTLGADHTVRLWQRGNAREVGTFRPADAVTPLVYFPDGKQLAYGNKKNAIVVWDLLDGKQRHAWQAHDYGMWALAVSADGRRLVSGSWDQTARLWDAATGKRLQTLKHPGAVNSVVISADGKVILSVCTEGKFPTARSVVRAWDGTTGKMIRSLDVDGSWAAPFQLSPDGRFFTGGGGRDYYCWEVATGKRDRSPYGGSVDRVVFAPSGKAALVVDHYLRRVDGINPELGVRKGIAAMIPRSTTFSADGRAIALGFDDGSVRLVDAAACKEVRCFQGQRGAATSVLFSPDGRWLASGSTDGTILFWDLQP
jgi:WD40 repeat protein